MTRVQILILLILAITVCIVFGIAAITVRTQLMPSLTPAIAERPETESTTTLVPEPTWTPIPISTSTPTPTDTRLPTATYTRVVQDTATPTVTHTPAPTPTGTISPSPTRSSGGGGGTYRTPVPTPTPTSLYPFRIVGQTLAYSTTNYIFVTYARVTSADVLLPGYRLIGTHYPTGAHIESEPSCPYLCRASGPSIEDYLIQEGNLVFEAFFYDTGSWSLMLVDPQGRQVSEILHIGIDIRDRKWFYYHLNR